MLEDNINYKALPSEDGEETVIKFDMGDKGVTDINLKSNKRPDVPYQRDMYDSIRNFENEAWSDRGKGYKTGFNNIDDAFEGGLKPGFILIAGDSNLGKTALISQIAYNTARKNEDVFVMDFSLDDPSDDKISRVVACDSRVIINSIKNPKNYIEFDKMLTRRKVGLNRLYNNVDRYRIYDATFTTNIEDIELEIENIINTNKKYDIYKELIVFIDNFHDLNTSKYPNLQDKQKYDYLAQKCADIAIKYKIPFVCSAELRKVNGSLRPKCDDVRESTKIKYEAKAILLCYSDVHYKGEGSEIYFNRKDKVGKQPIFEVHFGKNKISSFKGRLYFEFYPEMSYLKECNKNDTDLYSSLIYN